VIDILYNILTGEGEREGERGGGGGGGWGREIEREEWNPLSIVAVF
jgi:hypothetical protein